MAKVLGDGFRKLAWMLLPSLVNLSACGNKVISGLVSDCVHSVLQHTHVSRGIPKITELVKHRYVDRCMQQWLLNSRHTRPPSAGALRSARVATSTFESFYHTGPVLIWLGTRQKCLLLSVRVLLMPVQLAGGLRGSASSCFVTCGQTKLLGTTTLVVPCCSETLLLSCLLRRVHENPHAVLGVPLCSVYKLFDPRTQKLIESTVPPPKKPDLVRAAL